MVHNANPELSARSYGWGYNYSGWAGPCSGAVTDSGDSACGQGRCAGRH
jgi:hypothetical protein